MKLIPYPLFFFLFLWGNIQAKTTLINGDTLTEWVIHGTVFDFILIDLRGTDEISAVIGAQQCHPYQIYWNDGTFATTQPGLPQTMAIVLYCAGGVRSNVAAGLLDQKGYTAVYDLEFGFNNWKGPTLPLNSAKPLSDLPEPSRLAKTTRIKKNFGSIKTSDLSVYPNPFGNEIFISFTENGKKVGGKGKTVLKIMNVQGKLIYSSRYSLQSPISSNAKGFVWDGRTNQGHSLPNGNYLIQLTNGKIRHFQKVILTR